MSDVEMQKKEKDEGDVGQSLNTNVVGQYHIDVDGHFFFGTIPLPPSSLTERERDKERGREKIRLGSHV